MSAIVNMVGRLGRDTEVRYTPQNLAVANIAVATDVGYGDKKQTQWWELSIFGKQAESLEAYLKKGSVFQITAKDVLYKTFEKKDGTTGGKLTAIVVDVAFVPKQNDAPSEPKPAPQPKRESHGDGLDSDIPF